LWVRNPTFTPLRLNVFQPHARWMPLFWVINKHSFGS
jgi:hypothetical protein